MRCVQRRVLRWYDKNNASSNFWNLTNDAPRILLIRGPGIRVPSSAQKYHEESQDSSWYFPFLDACTLLHIFCTPAGKPCFSLHCLHPVHREQSLSGALSRQARWDLWQRVSGFTRCVKMVLQILLQECSDSRTYSTAFKRFPVQSMYFCILTTCL